MEKVSETSDTYLSFFLSTEGLMEKASLFLIDSALQSKAGLECIKDQMLTLITMIPWSSYRELIK